jgi:dienelactone hydrolase
MRSISQLIRAAAACVGFAGVALAQSAPSLRVTPPDALVDSATTIVASGLAPNQVVAIAARAVDGHGQLFASQARFKADDQGTVDVSGSKATGSYNGVDAMGLFWSMEPENPGRRGGQEQRFWLGTEPVQYQVELIVDGHVVTTAQAVRRPVDGGVRMQATHERGLVASVAIPAGEGKHPAVLHFGGSEGGLPHDPLRAALLASRGYVVLSLAYFNADSLPATLSRIPIEYFRAAIDWLKGQPYVDADRIGVMSGSRGTEAALLLAARFEDVRAVVVMAPSSVVWGGFDPAQRRGTGTSPWTEQGRPIPYMTAVPGQCARSGATGADLFRCALTQYHEAVLRAVIQVEKVRAPVLLTAGLDDRVWPSDLMARQIEERRAKAGIASRDTALYLPDSGHVMPTWYGPPALDFERYGGNREGSAKAFEKAWPAILHFLHAYLGGLE